MQIASLNSENGIDPAMVDNQSRGFSKDPSSWGVMFGSSTLAASRTGTWSRGSSSQVSDLMGRPCRCIATVLSLGRQLHGGGESYGSQRRLEKPELRQRRMLCELRTWYAFADAHASSFSALARLTMAFGLYSRSHPMTMMDRTAERAFVRRRTPPKEAPNA